MMTLHAKSRYDDAGPSVMNYSARRLGKDGNRPMSFLSLNININKLHASSGPLCDENDVFHDIRI